MSEILVVDREQAERLCGGPLASGFLPVHREDIEQWLSGVPYRFCERDAVETNPRLKQLIPYVVVACFPMQDEVPTVLAYRRTKKVGEQRLAGLRSIGFGGHIEKVDSRRGKDMSAKVQHLAAAQRELNEELPQLSTSFVGGGILGLVNDESNEVGSVHLGIVHVAVVRKQHPPRNGDAGHAELAYHDFDNLLQSAGEFETWSGLCLQSLRFMSRLMTFLTHNRRLAEEDDD